MRVLISADMEGTAGVAIWEQVMPPDLARRPAPAEYEWARTLMVNEVNAAIEGARAAGATEVIVNDSHAPHRRRMMVRPVDASRPRAWLRVAWRRCESDNIPHFW